METNVFLSTGWNAVRSRADQLGLHMTDEQVKEV